MPRVCTRIMTTMRSRRAQQAIDIINSRGIIRPKDLAEVGIRRDYLAKFCRQGIVVRVGRGLYAKADIEATEHYSLAEASKRIPAGIVCLLSALQFHELTTQIPYQVWMAVDRKSWLPEHDLPYVNIVRFSGNALKYGIEEYIIEGVNVRVFNPSKTVADCFKYRNKIGMDVALEALRDCWRQRKATMDQLWDAAEVCRVANVMRPYMESLV